MALTLELAKMAAKQAQPEPTNPAAPRQVTDDDFILRPTEAAGAMVDQRLASALTPVQQQMQAFATAVAGQTRMLAASKFPDVFGNPKWAAEVDEALRGVAPEMQTLDNIEKVVKYVRGNHMNEIAEERAKAMLASGGLGERSTGANGIPVSGTGVDLNKLTPEHQELMRRHGVGIAQIQDFCKANPGWTVEKWFAEAQNKKLFTQASPMSVQLTEEALGSTRQFA